MNARISAVGKELRSKLAELTRACPFHQANPEDCPLFPLRNMNPRRRRQWFDALPEADLRYLANYHHVCLQIKLAAQSSAHP